MTADRPPNHQNEAAQPGGTGLVATAASRVRLSSAEVQPRKSGRGAWRIGTWIAAAVGGVIPLIVVSASLAQDGDPFEIWDPPDAIDGIPMPSPWAAPQERPDDHTSDWIAIHGGGQPTDCAGCHSEQFCSDCHAGLVEPTSVHGPGFLLLHGPQAADATNDCAGCHTTTSFCVGCHNEARVTDVLRPSPDYQVHPPGWLQPTSFQFHAEEAIADIGSCAGCHSGDSCSECHTFVSPHGAQWASRCGQMLNAGSPTCASCHTPTSAMPMDAVRRHPGCQ